VEPGAIVGEGSGLVIAKYVTAFHEPANAAVTSDKTCRADTFTDGKEGPHQMLAYTSSFFLPEYLVY
jgi:hypothetical protein